MPLEHGLEKLPCGDLSVWPGVLTGKTRKRDREKGREREREGPPGGICTIRASIEARAGCSPGTPDYPLKWNLGLPHLLRLMAHARAVDQGPELLSKPRQGPWLVAVSRTNRSHTSHSAQVLCSETLQLHLHFKPLLPRISPTNIRCRIKSRSPSPFRTGASRLKMQRFLSLTLPSVG